MVVFLSGQNTLVFNVVVVPDISGFTVVQLVRFFIELIQRFYLDVRPLYQTGAVNLSPCALVSQ